MKRAAPRRTSVMIAAAVSAMTAMAGPAYAQTVSPQSQVLDRGDAVVSGFAGIVPSNKPLAPGENPLDHFFIDTEGPAAQILSLRALGAPPQGQHTTAAPRLRVKAADVGQVFAIALDDGRGRQAPNIFLGATSAYGLHIAAPNGAAPGIPKRLKTGSVSAQWMAGMFGIAAGGGPGAIWRVDGVTGVTSLFANLPANSGPGIGDIVFDAVTGQVFASDLDSGLIYRLKEDGTLLDSYDHGLAGRQSKGLAPVVDDGRRADITDPVFDTTNAATWGLTQPERRVAGMAMYQGRLFYAVVGGQQIWSVGITASGSFANDARWELDVSGLAGPGPITDMIFDADGQMVLAQRGEPRNSYDFSLFSEPGKSSVVRYRKEAPDDPATASVWSADRSENAVGMQPDHRWASGGIALGYRHDEQGALRAGTCGSMLWSTGDRLRPSGPVPSPNDVHGLQGNDIGARRPDNAPPTRSYFVDYDQMFGDAEKAGHVGDVEIWQPCGGPDFAESGPGLLPPGYLPPGDQPPADFPDPTYPFNTNLELTKNATGPCFAWAGGWACRYDIRIRNTGPDVYWAPIVIADHLPGAPAGAVMGFGASPSWTCWNAGAASYGCWRPTTFLAPGASVWLTAFAWVPASYPLCHLPNIAEIKWAPGGSLWNTNLLDDIDDATAMIPAANCPPPGGNTNLRLQKVADPAACTKDGGNFLCRYRLTVTNTGPGVYNGDIVVRDKPPVGTAALFGAGWDCVPADGYNCSKPAAVLNPGQDANMWMLVIVPAAQAQSNACQIENKARILAAAGGTPKNTNPLDDADAATATIPAEFCQPPAVLAQCPAGFQLKDGACAKRQGGGSPPVVVPPRKTPERMPDRPERPQVCPEGTIGTFPNCRRPERPDQSDRPKVCPNGTVGTFPNCRRPERPDQSDRPKVCPNGTVGTYPNCRRPERPDKPERPKVCPQGTTGAFPNCRKVPSVRNCPQGSIGRPPNCRPLSILSAPKFKPLQNQPSPSRSNQR
ncbi:MAG: hypothetical protein SH859_02645 [Hyphomicrobium aestuarii]|nr:hypothetical protein [Hyphomicrobium aestuarii]